MHGHLSLNGLSLSRSTERQQSLGAWLAGAVLCKCGVKNGLDKRVVAHSRIGCRLRKVLILPERWIRIRFDHEQLSLCREPHVQASESPDLEKAIDIARELSQFFLSVGGKRRCRSVRNAPLLAIGLVPLGIESSELRNVLRYTFEED